MSHEDWHAATLESFGMLLTGATFRDVGVPGDLQIDKTYLLLFNPGALPAIFVAPIVHAGSPKWWIAQLASDNVATGTRYPVDQTIEVPPFSLLVLEAGF
jgi:hypothetical protein